MEAEADAILDDFIKLGLTIEKAKQCAIKSLRQNISQLKMIDGVYWIGLQPIMDQKMEMILYIVDK